MIRSELIRQIAEEFPHLPPKDVAAAVMHLLEQMSEALARGERLDIRGFGAFVIRRYPGALVRYPAPGSRMAAGSRRVPPPRAGRELRQRVNESA